MPTQVQQVLNEAIKLPPIERAELLERILASFDFQGRAENDAAWAKEADARLAACNRGEIPTVPAAVVFEKIEKKCGA